MIMKSDKVTLAQVQCETERLSPLKDFTINFIDRQRLKQIEDKVLDLKIIFESLQNTVIKMQRQCKSHCTTDCCQKCICSSVLDDLKELDYEIDVNLRRSEILYKRTQGTAHLVCLLYSFSVYCLSGLLFQLSDLLDYENAQVAHHNEVSLNKLVQESKEENSKMRMLTVSYPVPDPRLKPEWS
jgi:hypothetical protein